jgi:hypothetical protein
MTSIEAAKAQLAKLSQDILAAIDVADWDVVAQRQTFRLQRVKHFLQQAAKDESNEQVAAWIDEIRAEDETIKHAVLKAQEAVRQKIAASKHQQKAAGKYKTTEQQKD